MSETKTARHATYEPTRLGLTAERFEDCPRCLRTVALVNVGGAIRQMAMAVDFRDGRHHQTPTDYVHVCGVRDGNGHMPERRMPLGDLVAAGSGGEEGQ